MTLVSSSTSTHIPATVFNYANDSERECNTRTQNTKVLHLINGEHFSGAERVQQLLGKRLDGFGYAPSFGCLKPGKFRDKCQLRGGQILDFPMRGRIDLSVVKQISGVVVSEGYALLHAHTPRTALVAGLVARRTGLPWVYHVHSPTARDSTRGLTNRVNAWVERYSIRSCSRLLTVSRSLRREMLRLGVQRNRLQVVANGVPAFEPIAASERLGNTSWRLGIVALMRPRKGVEVALEALSRLPRERDISLDLIGGFETPEYEQQIRDQITTLGLEGRVHLLGFQNDVEDYVRRLDALLLPSLFGEGMPMVVLEALSAAVPVVATCVEGTPEVIRHGVEGLLADPCDSVDFAAQIETLTADRQKWVEMSCNALRRHRERFSDREMARRVATSYDVLLNREVAATDRGTLGQVP